MVDFAHLFPHSNLGCEPIIEWAKVTDLLGFDREQEAADKMTLLNMQAFSKSLHDMMDARDAVIAPIEQVVMQMGLGLESYLAGVLESGKPWRFDTTSQDQATSCKKEKVGKEDFYAHMCAFISLSRQQFQEPIHVDTLLGEGDSHTRDHRRRLPNGYASPPACQARLNSPRHTLLVTHFPLFAAYFPHSSSHSLPLPTRSSTLLSGKMHGMRARMKNTEVLMACLKNKSRDHPSAEKRTKELSEGGRRGFADLAFWAALDRHGHRAPLGHPQRNDLQRFGKNLRQGNKNAEKAKICLTMFLGDLIEYAHLLSFSDEDEELLTAWAQVLGILRVAKKEAEADKIKVTNLQPLRKDLHDILDAHEAVTVPVLEVLIKMALELEAYVAEMLESGKPWLLETKMSGKIGSCAEFYLDEEWQRVHKFVFVNFATANGEEGPIMVDNLLGDDKKRYELHSRPAASDKHRWPADFSCALPDFPSFLDMAAAVGVVIHKTKAQRGIKDEDWRDDFRLHRDVIECGSQSVLAGSVAESKDVFHRFRPDDLREQSKHVKSLLARAPRDTAVNVTRKWHHSYNVADLLDKAFGKEDPQDDAERPSPPSPPCRLPARKHYSLVTGDGCILPPLVNRKSSRYRPLPGRPLHRRHRLQVHELAKCRNAARQSRRRLGGHHDVQGVCWGPAKGWRAHSEACVHLGEHDGGLGGRVVREVERGRAQ